ncbi:MAG: gliding motility-associated C-terminal domain-containing protein [Prevotellaceae bacterium]|nr:gliding motility-associated C-terminal domain-containing protein [Prevotellaceae bacterium]
MNILDTRYNKLQVRNIFCISVLFILSFGMFAQNSESTHEKHRHNETSCIKCTSLGYGKCRHVFDYIVPPPNIVQIDPADPGSNNRCNKFVPFCADGVMKYETTSCPKHPQNSIETCDICSGQQGFNYGCLLSYPRPAWFCMRVETAGTVVIHVESSIHEDDIDIAIWGPFDSPTEACSNYFYGQSPIACSYSTNSYETMTIPSAVENKYYMMVITNYRNYLATVSITMPNMGQPGAGKLSCNIVYECSLLSISTNAISDSCGNYYNVSGVIDFTNAPDSSRLCVINTAMPSDTFFINPPFSELSEYAYFFNNISFDSVSPKIIAWFETDTACHLEQQYSLPVPQPKPPTLIMPDDVDLYTDANCYADTSVFHNGTAIILYNACLYDTNTIVTYTDSVYANSGTTVIKRKWTGINTVTGQATVKIQTISVIDTVKPVLNPPNDIVIYRNYDCTYDSSIQATGYATATDNCSDSENDITVTYNDAVTDTVIIRKWTAIDKSRNVSNYSQIITISDTIIPEIVTAPVDLNLECDGNGNIPEITEWLAANGSGHAYDCSLAITWTNNYDDNKFTADNCAGNKYQTVAFTITDARGNFTTCTAKITIIDTQKPYFITYPSDLVFRCDADNIPEKIAEWLSNTGGFSALDICSDSAITYSNNYAALNFDPTPDCNMEKTATVSFMASDLCGNILSVISKIKITPARANSLIVKNYSRTYGDTAFIIQAVSTSALPVEISIIEGESVDVEKTAEGYYHATIKHTGETRIEAVQNGNDTVVSAMPQIFTVTVNPAILKISLEDKTVKQCDYVPEYSPVYKGFVYGEAEDVLIQKPLIFCDATRNSAPGKYSVKISSAYAENYIIEYYNSTLEMMACFPNAFTPYNSDRLNDIFAEGYKIKVFSKNGQLVYEGDNGWDGTYKKTGKLLVPNIYYYIIFFGNTTYRGSIMLVKN